MAFKMLRLHSETLLPSAFAALSNASSSCGVNRTRRNFPLDSPRGNFGRPGFLVFFVSGTLFVLLKDYRLYGGLWGDYGRDVQNGDVLLSGGPV